MVLPKPVRLLTFAGLALAAVYLALNFSAAWVYMRAFTRPGCQANPPPLPGRPAAQEITLRPAGLALRAWYYPPRNGAVIILLGGLGGSLGETLPPAGFLLQAGYGLLQIDSRACAQPPAAVTLGAAEVQDAAAGLQFLQTRPEVQWVGVMGFSMGGAGAIRLAARYPQVAAVVAEGGFYNLGDDITAAGEDVSPLQRWLLVNIAAAYILQTGFNPWQVGPLDDLPRLSPRPVLLIYGEGEAGSGQAQSQYEAARAPKELWIVPGGAHGTNYTTAPLEYQQRVLAFFERARRLPSNPPAISTQNAPNVVDSRLP